MMTILRKILHIDETKLSPENARRIERAEKTLESERQTLRQNIQVLDSGTRVMLQWANANAMVRGTRHDTSG